MAALKLDSSSIEVLVLSSGTVSRAYTYDPETKSRSDRTDKETGLPVWQVPAELFDTEQGSLFVGNLKVISEDEPKLVGRGVYRVEGALLGVNYTSGDRAQMSYSVRGSLQPLQAKKGIPAAN